MRAGGWCAGAIASTSLAGLVALADGPVALGACTAAAACASVCGAAAVASRRTESVAAAANTERRSPNGPLFPADIEIVPKGWHDLLTGLPDRESFKVLLDAALSNAAPDTVAMLLVDVDRFKLVNDTLGHAAGDVVLASMASRFVEAARGDAAVARLGGDEFGALIVGANAERRAIALAETLTSALSHTYAVGGHELFVTTSTGVATNCGHEAGDLMRKADIAVYRAKAHGRACFAVFDPAVDYLSEDRLRLDNGLRRAIDHDELELHYQPEFDLETGEVVGMEALVRWNHPHRGLLMPTVFLELAEESGEIVRIGDWSIRQAAQYLAELQATGVVSNEFTVAVNISATELLVGDLAAAVDCALAESGIEPQNLKLEMTETVVMRDIGASIDTLNRLAERGVRLAIDDFGTGYSSLSYIHQLPFDTLKIDQSFVRTLNGPGDDRALAIVASIVYLGKASMMQVTAEGIETAWQLDYLRAVGAHTGQGYYISQPLPRAELERFLGERVSLAA